MSYADVKFIEMCRNILDKNERHGCRAVWEDGTQSETISDFAVVNRYDLKREFPILTLRPVPLKSAIDEILWIYQKKSNNIKDLNSHIWDQWADENGSIGAAYGFQVKSQLRKVWKKIDSNESKEVIPLYLDQTDFVLHELKYNPFSRRIIINLFIPGETGNMALEPCAFMVNFRVSINKKTGKKVLNSILYQRSQDILVANGWNVAQYAALTHMFAQVTDMAVGEFVHLIADAHIYDKHIEIVKELITKQTYEAPKFVINPHVKNFYDFTVDDFKLENYKTNEQIKGIPVAI